MRPARPTRRPHRKLPTSTDRRMIMNPRLIFKRLMGALIRIGTPLSVLLIALTLSQSSNAQEVNGSIVGKVKDKFDAVVPGATVRITHKETNQTRETASS